jgi:hypothetical protein
LATQLALTSTLTPEIGRTTLTEHPDLESLARQLLAILDPLAKAAASFASAADGEPGKCQQVWCPVCAALALASGEQHPLMTVLTEHGASLLELVRAMATPDAPAATGRASDADDTEHEPGRYQPIPVTIHD